MTLMLRYAARSDRGLVRQSNQDSVYAGPRLLALADGMGGHAAGEVASRMVIAAFVPLDEDDPGADLLDRLGEATHTGNAAIGELIDEDPELDGMGTTLTAVLFAGNTLGLAHVGDSRAYQVRNGTLSQITHDDTFVQSLIDQGRITEEEAEHHPQRSLLLKALTGHEVEPSLTVREARAGDRYLLCSDGLSGVVSHATLAEALSVTDPQACADRLIELALKGGGPDNVTCIVADVVDVDFGEDRPVVGGAAGDGFEDPPPNSSASRASTATSRASAATLPRTQAVQPEPIELGPEPSARPRGGSRPLRWALSGLTLLAVIAVVAVAGYWWLGNQYYVGATAGGMVVIYRGVQGAVLGTPLHTVAENSCPKEAAECEEIRLSDLTPAVRNEVEAGITAPDSLQEARETIERLRSQRLLPPCPDDATSATTADSPPSTTPGSSPPSPTSTFFADPAQQTTPASTPEAPHPTPQPEPGVDCRVVR